MGEIKILDRQALLFERLALTHVDSIYNAALRLTGSVADAEDLSQETFLRAYRFFYRFQPDSNMGAWLFRIMKNIYYNRFREKAREPLIVSPGVSANDLSFEARIRQRRPKKSSLVPCYMTR